MVCWATAASRRIPGFSLRALALLVLVAACTPIPKGGAGTQPPPGATSTVPTTPTTAPPTTPPTTPTTPPTTPATTETGDTGVDWTYVSYVDEGNLCLQQPYGDLHITVVAPTCVGGEVADPQGTCDAVLDGAVITLTSSLTWKEHSGGGADFCAFVNAMCTVPALPAGDYTLVHGTTSTPLTFPLAEPCVPYYDYYYL